MRSNQAPVSPYVLYADVASAIEFLTNAFGFAEGSRMTDGEGIPRHAELHLGTSVVMIGQPGDGFVANPGDHRPILLHVYVDNVDEHYAKAKAAGAKIVEEPVDKPYGDRSYACHDLEGHKWFFSTHGTLIA